MKTFNLSDWALGHRSLVWYFMLAFMAAGLFSYLQLGRQEDPDFTIKTMVIGAQWPGASPEEMTRQVTDRIEKKLEELESLDYTKSVTVAGQTTVFVYLRDSTKAADVARTWARVRNMIADIKGDFPQGVIGPGFNDRFGDVFGNIYAFTSDGLTQRQLRDRVEDIRAKVLTVPNVGKVDILGAQDEKIFLEFSTRKIAALGLDTRSIVSSLQAQNAVAPSGVFQEGPERISVRVNGQFASEESLKAINLRVNDRFFPLTDVATITRGYADPPTTLFRFNGQPAIALAIGMKSGANLLKFGEALKEEMSKILAEQPIGLGVHLVADQPVVVEHAVSNFTEALFEAVVIVLGISFLSLGLRAGLVVAIAIPLVLAITFVVMAYNRRRRSRARRRTSAVPPYRSAGPQRPLRSPAPAKPEFLGNVSRFQCSETRNVATFQDCVVQGVEMSDISRFRGSNSRSNTARQDEFAAAIGAGRREVAGGAAGRRRFRRRRRPRHGAQATAAALQMIIRSRAGGRRTCHQPFSTASAVRCI
jgi:multidrug efflux pump